MSSTPPGGLRQRWKSCTAALNERRNQNGRPNNELYVRDTSRPLNVSREHFQIEARDDGSFELVDRGSACGTIVGDRTIGGNYTKGTCPLKDGDLIVVGNRESPIVFKFLQSLE